MSRPDRPLPGTKHKVIGLVSGGKDSCFNLMHCIANGHEVVALATLTPEPGIDELDSHLYQSVGTHLLPLIAQAMDLPLFTRVIKGKAVERGPEYGSRLRGGAGSGMQGDETEDLTGLLEDVMSAHPEATALSSGAILSTYQRLRIEHVCSRMGLTSLSFLWQATQLPLLDRMLSSGVEAVLMKVAGVGLGVDIVGKQLGQVRGTLAKLVRAAFKFLQSTAIHIAIADPKTLASGRTWRRVVLTIEAQEERYGSHPAGEGGEYETLTLSTPLFSHRVILSKTRTVITDPEPYPVAYLKVEEAVLEKKEGWVKPTVSELREMLGLDEAGAGDGYDGYEAGEGLDEEGREVWEALLADKTKTEGVEQALESLNIDGDGQPETPVEILDGEGEKIAQVSFAKRGRWFVVSVQGRESDEQSVGEELRGCFDAISETLKTHSLSLPLHATHITLLLSSMSLFAPANEVYKTYFGTSPPSRATVAVPLTPGEGRVRVEVVGFDDRAQVSVPSVGSKVGTVGGRQALHVQGLSYWAPANIGPYSQAVIVNSRVHLAGQIPLLPASLTLPLPPPAPASPYPHQAALALQHVGRIVNVLRSKNSTGGGWTGWVESVVGWWAASTDSAEVDGGAKWVRLAWRIWGEKTSHRDATLAPAIFVQAKELPRGALVEYQVNYNTGRKGVDDMAAEAAALDAVTRELGDEYDDDEDDEEDDEDAEPHAQYNSGANYAPDVWWEGGVTYTSPLHKTRAQGSRATIFFAEPENIDRSDLRGVTNALNGHIAVRVYHLPYLSLAPLLDTLRMLGVETYTLIPVLSICDRGGKPARVALEIFGI